jgi:hypothetical protein
MENPFSDLTPRPDYLSEDGTLDILKKWEWNPKQLDLYNLSVRQILAVGGVRSGKTAGAEQVGIQKILLRYPKSNGLILRRTYKELKSGPIEDFREHVPQELYTLKESDLTAHFVNGSKLVFGHCKTGKDRDIEQYLGTAYPFILVDECSQFSADAWTTLFSRNTVNPECEPDRTQPCGGCGNPQQCGYPCLPDPIFMGATNPFGPFWDYYHSQFVLKEPYFRPDGAKRDRNGRYWIVQDGIDPQLIFDPNDYGYVHSTVLDNPHALKRDPGLISRLNMLPKGKRDKFLLGLMDKASGVYFECWEQSTDVIDTRLDPEAIIWQHWQPVWGGWDWAIGTHWNTCYFFTKALVRNSIGGEYRLKTICFREYVTQGKTDREMSAWIAQTLKWPDTGELIRTIHAIYFSHEKFDRQVGEHTPADMLSQELMVVGLPGVSPAASKPGSRIARASLMYQMLAHRELVILDTCTEIIRAIPNLMRNPDILDDVFKPKGANKADDCYDGFSYGLFGYFNPEEKPEEIKMREKLASMDSFNRHLEMWKRTMDRKAVDEMPEHRPYWQDRKEEK